MSKPMIATASVLPEEAEELREMRASVRRVHKSLPLHAPARVASAELSNRLSRLHRRGVPLHILAELVGLSHQAVRVRVRYCDDKPVSEPTSVMTAPTLREPTSDVVLVCDAGVHRRLHVYDPPTDVGHAFLSMIEAIPLLGHESVVIDWLESETTADPPHGAPATATRLRTPPAVYVVRGMLDRVLTPLTSAEPVAVGSP